MTVIGADRVIRKLGDLPKEIKAQVDADVRKSAEELVRVAKILIPVGGDVHGDGQEREKIVATPNADGSVLVDFGPKSKPIEGGGKKNRKPRPFVNPALAVTRKRFKARAARAARQAVRQVFGA
ncbi:MAG: hypothetical protein ACK4OP_01180 [Gemmobacter sp.]